MRKLILAFLFAGLMLLIGGRGYAQTWDFQIQNQFESTNPEILEKEFREFLLWSLTPEARNIKMTLTRFPVEGKGDFNGGVRIIEEFTALSKTQKLTLLKLTGSNELRKKVFSQLEPQIKREIVLNAIDLPTAQGDSISLFQMLVSYFGLRDAFSDSEVEDAIVYIATTRDGIRYDGERGKFIYDDKEAEYHAAILGMTANIEAQRFKNILNSTSDEIKDKIKVNRNGSDQISRTEPFDQIQSMILRQEYVKSGWGISHLPLTKIVHRSLYQLLDMTGQDDDRGGTLPDIILEQNVNGREKINILCAGDDLKITPEVEGSVPNNTGFTGIVSVKTVGLYDLYEATQKGQNPNVLCAHKTYPLQVGETSKEPLPLPPPFDITKIAEKGKVQVLVAYTLTRESDAKLLSATIAYLSSRGWVFRGMTKNQNTKAFFTENLPKSDIFIPAAHSIDINHLPLGTETSSILRFSRFYRGPNGKLIPFEIVASFPENGARVPDIEVSASELSDLLSKRRSVSKDSLFVLTSSCNSAGAILTWTNAYRASLEQDIRDGKLGKIEDATDLLHAIAFKGGFPTATPSDLIYDFAPALMTVEQLGKGHSPEQVFNSLKLPIPRDLFTRGLMIIERIFGIKSQGKNMALDPVYNINIPAVLNGGISVKLGEIQ